MMMCQYLAKNITRQITRMSKPPLRSGIATGVCGVEAVENRYNKLKYKRFS